MKIFINYRRKDSADITGRIYDRLVAKFGKKAVFKDVDSIPLGVNFRDYLDAQVGQCNIFLPVIGQDWLTLKNKDGKRRIDEPDDFVRIEIESALQHNMPIIPVFVQGIADISRANLPPSIQNLALMNGLQVRSDPDFHRDVDRLISGIRKVVGKPVRLDIYYMPNWVLFTFQLMLFPCLSAFLSVTGLVLNPLLSILAGAVIIVLYYYLMRNTINLDFARGIRQIKAGRYKAAIDSFKKSVAQYEKYPFLDKWRFIIFLSSSRYGFHEMALTNLAFAYIKSGELSSAKKCYEECLRINPDNQTAKNISSLIDISPREITEAG